MNGNFSFTSDFPGLGVLPGRLIVRRFSGAPDPGEWLGAGFLRKETSAFDNIDFRSERHVLVWVLRGTGVYRDGRGTFPLESGMFFQRLPGRIHSSLADPGSGYIEFYLSMGPKLCRALGGIGVLPNETPAVQAAAVTSARCEAAWRYLNHLRSAGEFALPELAGELIALTGNFRHPAGSDGRSGEYARIIELACAALAADWRKPPDLRIFCRRHGLGYENFRKLFRKQTGRSPGRYRLFRRLELADCLLLEEKLSISAIAFRLGYGSVYDFSAQFKKHRGVSPRRFRKSGAEKSGI